MPFSFPVLAFTIYLELYLLLGRQISHPPLPHYRTESAQRLRGHPHRENRNKKQQSQFVEHIPLWVLQNSSLMEVEHWPWHQIQHSQMNQNQVGNLKKKVEVLITRCFRNTQKTKQKTNHITVPKFQSSTTEVQINKDNY